ncbi:hypothetical protein [Bosea sp. (in: a-proteobacteria)]|uniref:hypothetical protein n=1 Tax=Bosea sp. (in: a-proteobacteria) TaxID=1871050 RepID=UPI003F7054AB
MVRSRLHASCVSQARRPIGGETMTETEETRRSLLRLVAGAIPALMLAGAATAIAPSVARADDDDDDDDRRPPRRYRDDDDDDDDDRARRRRRRRDPDDDDDDE